MRGKRANARNLFCEDLFVHTWKARIASDWITGGGSRSGGRGRGSSDGGDGGVATAAAAGGDVVQVEEGALCDWGARLRAVTTVTAVVCLVDCRWVCLVMDSDSEDDNDGRRDDTGAGDCNAATASATVSGQIILFVIVGAVGVPSLASRLAIWHTDPAGVATAHGVTVVVADDWWSLGKVFLAGGVAVVEPGLARVAVGCLSGAPLAPVE
ncbi:hypothetical protein MMPV_004500 [Pyropia vietnamensis]